MIFHGVTLSCINHAATQFHVPAIVIVSVMQTERGWNGAAIKNKNGTYDLGLMQINTCWLNSLKPYGITQKSLQFDPCVNVTTAAWILAKGLAKNPGWQGVANYHSATPLYNQTYRQKVRVTYAKLQHALEASL